MNKTAPDINPKHKKFVDEYILTDKKIESYIKIYPDAKRNSAQAESSKILKLPKVAEYEKSERERIRKEREERQNKAIISAQIGKILKREEGLAILTEIAELGIAKIRKKVEDTGVEGVSMYDVQSVNNTIEKIAKIDGWEKPAKIMQTDENGNAINQPFVLQVIKTYKKDHEEAQVLPIE